MTGTAPERPNSAPGLDPVVSLKLPIDAWYHLARTLSLALPTPPSDNPEHLLQRNHAAIATVAALVPANSAEANLAADFVAAEEQARDCLRLAQLPGTTPEKAMQCRAEARSMMREARSALRSLLVLQKERRTRDSDSAACTSAAWTEHCALRLMQAALAPEPPEAPAAPWPEPPWPDTGTEPPPPAMPEPQPAPAAAPEPVFIEEDAEFDPIAEAEHYAAIYPERAALIRRAGRVPDTVTFGPPDDELVQTLITARTPALATLDREYAQAHAA